MKKVVVIILLLVLCGGGYYFYTDRQVIDSKNLVVYGNIDIRDVSLGFRVGGRITTLYFEEGDRVQGGQLMAQLDPIPFEEELAVQVAQENELRVRLVNAEKQYIRQKNLVATGAVSRSSFDDALNNKNEIEAGIETAINQVRQATTRLEDTKLFAPDSGIVLTRVREPGSIVGAGEPVYSISLTEPIWARCYVAETDLGKIYPGKKATIHTDSGGVYSARVGFISPQAEFTPKTVETTQLRTDLVYRFRVVVDEVDDGLRQGMPVTVTLGEDE